MTDLLLSPDARAHLARLQGARVRQLVWDLNAIYCVADEFVLKVEAEMRVPPSPEPGEFDEVACLAVGPETEGLAFRDEGEEGHWYRVVARDTRVEGVEVVRAGIAMPGEEVWALGRPAPPGSFVTPCDCGMLLTTPGGVLPAVQTENAYGFMNWPEVRLYERGEVLRLLGERYEVLPL